MLDEEGYVHRGSKITQLQRRRMVYLVVPLNQGTPIWTPKYYDPCYRDPPNDNPNIGKTPLSSGVSKLYNFVGPGSKLNC